jgi:hypothetical protein
VQVYQLIDKAQSANRDELGGHGQKARTFSIEFFRSMFRRASLSKAPLNRNFLHRLF